MALDLGGGFFANLRKVIMKIKGSPLAAIAAWLLLAPAYAQQQAQDASAADTSRPIDSVVVTARRFHLEPPQFRDYEYTYVLSNGDVVRFSRRVGRFYVTLKGRPEVEIFPTAHDRFETELGARLVFTDEGDKLTIDRYEELRLAAGVPLAGMLAAPR
jgi:hypothetical protein